MDDARIARFWAAVRRGSADECWPWLQSVIGPGYGAVTFKGQRTTAHRIAYLLTVGPINDGLYVLHKCDNPRCCNPRHLFVGSQRENMADMRAKGRAGDCRVFGERHGRAKFSDKQIASVRAARSMGLSQDAIAQSLSMSQSHVGRILRGENRARTTA